MEPPVVSATHGFIRSLPAKLQKLVSPEEANNELKPEGLKLRRCEKKKIRLLKDQIQQLIDKYLLMPSEVAEFPALATRCWVEEVRELSYDIDDFHDELINNLRKGLYQGRWITCEISWFRNRLEKAIQRYKNYNLHESEKRPESNISSSDETRQVPPLDARPVGIEGSMSQIQTWLSQKGGPRLEVVAVVGLGGVGKTTLAKELYCKIRKDFECHAFVRSSKKPDMRKLLTSILLQVRPHMPPDVSESCNLTNTIKAHLQHKKYFIIIDEIWALSIWDLIYEALPDDYCYSRILITSEVDGVAHRCCYNSGHILRMEPLSEDWSRDLFLSIYHGKKHDFPAPSSEVSSEDTYFKNEISSEIISKCGGFPLAIVSIASLLATRSFDNIEQWSYIWSSLCSNFGTSPTIDGMRPILSLCYNSLPDHLKTCLLYLSIYDENQIIWKDDLVKQWIAEGFICAKEGEDMEEVASTYFGQLVTKGMVQPVHNSHNGEVQSCTVHYMILQLIRCKSIEDNFVIAIHHSETNTRLTDKVRRLSLHFGDSEGAKPPERIRLSQVRTLAFFGLFKCMPPSLADFRLLRVIILDLWGDQDNLRFELPTVCNLRYLEIACNVKLKLQIELQSLQYLETLKIDSLTSDVPQDIFHLPCLLHLILPADTNLPNNIGQAISLRTFGCFDLSSNSADNVQSLCKLTNLRDLRLAFSTTCSATLEENLGFLSSILSKLSNLKSLTLFPSTTSSDVNALEASSSCNNISGDHLSEMLLAPKHLYKLEVSPRIFIFSRLPSWIKNLDKLSILKVAVTELSQSHIDMLKNLSALSALLLYVRTAPQKRIVIRVGFQVLKHFKFICSTLCLEFEKGAMPKVQRLKIGFNNNNLNEYSLANAGFENLERLAVLSAKVGCAGDSEPRRQDVRSALEKAFSSCERRGIIIIIDLVNCNFYGEKEMSTVAKMKQPKTLEKTDATVKCGLNEQYETSDKVSLSEDKNSRADIRVTLSSDSDSRKEAPGEDGRTTTDQEKFRTTKQQGVIVEDDTNQHRTTTLKGSQEDRSNQTDCRSYMASESFSDIQNQDKYTSTSTQLELSEGTTEQKESRLPSSLEGFDIEGFFGQGEGIRLSNQTPELISPQVDSEHPRIEQSHDSPGTTKPPEKHGVPRDNVDEDKKKQYDDTRDSTLLGSSSHFPKSEEYSDKETQPGAKDESTVGYTSYKRERWNVAKERGDNRDNMPTHSSMFGQHPAGQIVEIQEPRRSPETTHKGLGKMPNEYKKRHYGSSEGWTRWRPMDTALAVIRYVIGQHMKLEGFRVEEIDSIKLEMELMSIIIEENKENYPGALPEKWVLRMQDLVHDIEDFIDVFDCLCLRSSTTRTLAHVGRLVHLKNRTKIIREWQRSVIWSKNEGSAAPSWSLDGSTPDYYEPLGILIGQDVFWEKLEVVCGSNESTVISIVGCHGVGKTALARSVYTYTADRYFDGHAWVVASECSSARDLLSKIMGQLRYRESSKIGIDIYKEIYIQENKRFLIVIDDLQQAGMWHDIQSALLGGPNPRNTIIVTTSIQSVAATCSPERYTIRMQGLNKYDSEKLFFNKIGHERDRTPTLDQALEKILCKCGGLPLALISIANYLLEQGQNLTERVVKIGTSNYLARAPGTLEGMNRALLRSYNSLPDSDHRKCLMSLSMFPPGDLIERKSLTRRWIAEGLVAGEQIAEEYFNYLIDLNIIEPVRIGFNSKAKLCRVHELLLEAIVHKAVCKNFVALIRKDDPLCKGAYPVRRLSVHSGTAESRRVAAEIGLRHVRSLTIYRSIPLELRDCSLLRVLDMEGCEHIDDGVLGVICRLLLLKYLSLRRTNVCRIPSEMKNLYDLETLDIRETKVKVLPKQILMLPRLAHLFGRFQLPGELRAGKKRRMLETFLSDKSRLHDMSGFVMVGNNDFEYIVLHARSLRKVKIWYEEGLTNYLSRLSLLSAFHERLFTANSAIESLSIDAGESITQSDIPSLSIYISDSDSDKERSHHSMLRSFKLRGRLERLPPFLRSAAGNLSELKLSSTGLRLEELSYLQQLPQLLYLKLAEVRNGFRGDIFYVQSGGFQSLRRLCFEAPKLPRVGISEGAMRALTSLHLLCSEFGIDAQEKTSEIAFSYESWEEIANSWEIERLQCLNEVLLPSSARDEVFDVWNKKVRWHRNEPKVIRMLPMS